MEHVGRNISKAREARGMTKAELARRMGWSQDQGSYVTLLERGKHAPKLETLVKIGAALDVTVLALLDPRAEFSRLEPISHSRLSAEAA